MQRFIKAVRKSVADANWYSALSLALLLPDICGYLETPEEQSGVRYARWFQQWLERQYSGFVPDVNSSASHAGTVRVFLSGEDCYALRCALSHEGSDNITAQRARQAIERFVFIVPKSGTFHKNLFKDTLQLQVSIFCEDICAAVEAWDRQLKPNDPAKIRQNELINIIVQ
jgi:hypothetical protein